MKKNISIHLICIFVIISLFLSLTANNICLNDDMYLPICRGFYNDSEWVVHGRFITFSLVAFLIKILPQWLNIHLQDFAFVSEGFSKAILLCSFLYIIYKIYNKFSKNEIKTSIPQFYGLSLLVLVSISMKLKVLFIYHSLIWFISYYVGLIFYLLLLLKLTDFYIFNKDFQKKDIFILIILSICNASSNEQVCYAFLFLAICIFVKNIINRKENPLYKPANMLKYLILLIIPTLITIYYTILTEGTTSLINSYKLKLFFDFSLSYMLIFIKDFITLIFIDNVLLWGVLILCVFIIFKDKTQVDTNKKFLNLLTYSLLGFIFFMLATYFLSSNCYACIYNYPHKYDFWLLHKGLLLQFDIFLFCITVFTAGYTINLKSSIKLKKIIISILLIFSISNIALYSIDYSNNNINYRFFHTDKTKKALYILDKISLFYFTKGQTAILPKQKYFYISELSPEELFKINTNTVYNKDTMFINIWYLVYLEHCYHVDTTPGIIFKPYDEAMKIFFENGGTFSKKELENLKFSYLKKDK